ncbi:MAG: hypothetical protein HC934_04105 [Acaryochloridaceae cyanobacterium SU_2_1]|nr:hypothetical protein [Acaryochloridaceae cyanobacterium SU_2_1]
MDLTEQIQTLIEEAPPEGGMPAAMRMIAPTLGQLATEQLHYPQYYILQNLASNWQLTTLQHRQHPELEKTVVYAFAHLEDATRSSRSADLIAVPIPIIQLLFQLLALTPVDSLLFIEALGSLDQQIEITRLALQQLIEQNLRPSPPIHLA